MQNIESAFSVTYNSDITPTRWTHILDLDNFLVRVYHYHQNNGYISMMLQEIFELNQFAFVALLCVYLAHGIRYNDLFNKSPNAKMQLSDFIMPLEECVKYFTTTTWWILIMAVLCFGLKFIRGIYQAVKFWEIKVFFNNVLNISDDNLENLTWHDVQSKLREAQYIHRMCIYKPELTELDIYHRILRQKNYLVAFVNKRLLPPIFSLPFVGEEVFWTKNLSYNVQWLLFWSPWSPFENDLLTLRKEYKYKRYRDETVNEFRHHILYLALCNLIFAPLIFFWQVMYAFFYYTDVFRRDPSKVGIRNWSLFALLCLRHFNELDHEIQARLIRAYRPATRYIGAFRAPIFSLITQHIGFISGSIMAIFIGLTLYDEKVLGVEHVITLISILGIILAVCRGVQTDDNVPWYPEALLSAVMIHTHYLPQNWTGHAHSWKIKKKFQQLFQFRVVGLIEDVLSPFITPIILWKCFYPKAGEIVDFLRHFTVTVRGVGDVCSFAEMDLRKHGSPDWLVDEKSHSFSVDYYNQSECGKVELSLLHFKTTNPNWIPPQEARDFVQEVEYNTIDPDISYVTEPFGNFELLNKDFMSHVDISKVEGPDFYTSMREMQKSALYLHDRRASRKLSTAPSFNEQVSEVGSEEY